MQWKINTILSQQRIKGRGPVSPLYLLALTLTLTLTLTDTDHPPPPPYPPSHLILATWEGPPISLHPFTYTLNNLHKEKRLTHWLEQFLFFVCLFLLIVNLITDYVTSYFETLTITKVVATTEIRPTSTKPKAIATSSSHFSTAYPTVSQSSKLKAKERVSLY